MTLADVDEKTFAGQVAEVALRLGWRRYHTFDSRRSAAGWPDEALVRERLVLLELKTEKGKLGQAQKDWLRALSQAQVECYIARPRHLEALALVLSARGPLLRSWLPGQRAAFWEIRTDTEREIAS